MITIRILSITAQKPFATGSGVYLCELVKGFAKMGHEQAVIFGGDYKEDWDCKELMVKSYKLAFNSEILPFPVFGMSDNMPYESSKYKTMDEEQSKLFKKEFEKLIISADRQFQPDIVICHHLYYVTAIAANILPHRKVVAICHGTCLRQMKNHTLEERFIKENILKLYKVFVLQTSQIHEVTELFSVQKKRIVQIGMGYNELLFNYKNKGKDCENKLVYAGKLSPSKGVEYLIKAIGEIEYPVELYIAGDGNDVDFIEKIKTIATEVTKKTNSKIYFLGRLSQKDLGELFRSCEIFVLPSFYEGLPLVIIEAIACGMKIVYSKIDGSYQWFENNFSNLALSGIDLIGIVNDDNKKDFNQEEMIINITKSIEKSLNQEYISQQTALENLKWDSLCDKIVKEISEF